MSLTRRTVKPIGGPCGTCDVPGNPDISLMALALAAKAEGTSQILHCSERAVVGAFTSALTALGLAVERSDDGVTVTGGGLRAPDGPLDAGKSEVLLACLTGLLAAAPFKTRIEGSARLTGDPRPVLDALRALDARFCVPDGGVFPIELGEGALRGGKHRIGSPSTAVKCAIFLAGLDAQGEVELAQSGAGDNDLELLFRRAGVPVEKARAGDGEGYRLAAAGPATVRPALHDLPGDPDATLFLLCAAAMLPGSDLTLNSVGNDWKTRRLLELLRRMNVKMEIQVAWSASKFPIRTVRVRSSELRRTKIAGAQADLFVDELPLLAVVAACAAGETIIRDAQALREGGTDCIALVAENLRRMQIRVGEIPDGLVIQGGRRLQGAEVDAGDDARVGMAFTLAGLVAQGQTVVVNPGVLEPCFSGVVHWLESVSQYKGG